MDPLGMKVDRELFIKCRLCLEDNGVYQIVPAVQEQINYCFGIVVEPFDGLPQLVCKKCILLLNGYSQHKKNFIDNQETLKKKWEEKFYQENNPTTLAEPELDTNKTKSDTDSDGKFLVKKQMNLQNPKKKRKRVPSTTTNSSDSSESPVISKKKRKTFTKNKTSTPNWQKKYTKVYNCRFCSKTYFSTSGFYKHYRHSHIKYMFNKIVNTNCTVKLDKFDNKPNLTGLTNTVVLSKNKIVQDGGNKLYYIVYVPCDNDKNSSENSDSSIGAFDSKKKKKKFRLSSRSSTDTLFIGDNNNPNMLEQVKIKSEDSNLNVDKIFDQKDTICIDSSDNETDCSTETCNDKLNSDENKSLNNMENKVDEKIISEIISVCRKRYETRKKSQVVSNVDKLQESQLKHKILSIGRKIINRKGFNNCTGLLRYLEHKNLNVVWERTTQMQASSSKEASFVRMLIKNSKQNTNHDEVGWVDLPEQIEGSSNTLTMVSITNSGVLLQAPSKQSSLLDNLPAQKSKSDFQVSKQKQIVSATVVQHQQMVEQPKSILKESLLRDQAVLYPNSAEDSNTQKLLNPFPVANPKQLPKKAHLNDTKSTHTTRPSINNMAEEINESDLLMPVITSTTSLAVNHDSNKKRIEDNVDVLVPRIKVKPVSELMKPANMVAISQPSDMWNYNHLHNEVINNENNVNILVPSNLVSQIQSQATHLPSVVLPSNVLPVDKVTSEAVEKTNNTNYITLHNVNFPNTKTDSPFTYLRNLLLLHDIILTEANANLTRDFECLIKFKVQFNQENKNLTLCISLHYSGNKFCICVRDANQVKIHMAKMTANWQWELIKVFQGDVSTKILNSAEKASQYVYSKTKTFLCLLKSITQK